MLGSRSGDHWFDCDEWQAWYLLVVWTGGQSDVRVVMSGQFYDCRW